jgi:hypothetical protein
VIIVPRSINNSIQRQFLECGKDISLEYVSLKNNKDKNFNKFKYIFTGQREEYRLRQEPRLRDEHRQRIHPNDNLRSLKNIKELVFSFEEINEMLLQRDYAFLNKLCKYQVFSRNQIDSILRDYEMDIYPVERTSNNQDSDLYFKFIRKVIKYQKLSLRQIDMLLRKKRNKDAFICKILKYQNLSEIQIDDLIFEKRTTISKFRYYLIRFQKLSERQIDSIVDLNHLNTCKNYTWIEYLAKNQKLSERQISSLITHFIDWCNTGETNHFCSTNLKLLYNLYNYQSLSEIQLNRLETNLNHVQGNY